MTDYVHIFIYLISVTALKVNVQSLNSVTNTISTLASNNKKRLTNSDSALGNICTLLDRLYNSESPARDCCHVTHSSSEVGNFMYCLSRTAASTIGFGNVGTGSCATTCSGLAPEWGLCCYLMLEFRQIDDFIVNYQVYIWECRLLQRILVPHRICH